MGVATLATPTTTAGATTTGATAARTAAAGTATTAATAAGPGGLGVRDLDRDAPAVELAPVQLRDRILG